MCKQLRIWLFVLLGTLLATSSLLAEGVITMTTSQPVGETIQLKIEASGSVTIDGAQYASGSDNWGHGYKYYMIKSQTVTIRGNVTQLICDYNQLTSLNVSGCTSLTKLYCQDNQLTSLDVSGCTFLSSLSCDYNQLTSLDVSKNTNLTTLNCYNNELTHLNATGCTALTMLECYGNPLTSINLSGCQSLNSFSWNSGKLTSLNVSGCTALKWLNCSKNRLTSLDVSGCTALTELECGNNRLTSLNVSGCTALTKLKCQDNPLTSINLSGCQSLKSFSWNSGKLTSLYVSGCTALTKLECDYNQLTSLDVSGCTSLTTLYCYNNPLTSVKLSGCQSLKEFSWTGGKLTSLNVLGCTALTKLDCYRNQLTSLNVSGCTALTYLNCSYNQLTSLYVLGCTSLTSLKCENNPLTSINLSGCQSLKGFGWSNGELTRLEVSGCTAMTSLDCSGNKLTRLDLSTNRALTTLDCSNNQLTNLNLSENRALTTLNCSDNQLTNLDLSENRALKMLKCFSNQLNSLDLSNHRALEILSCEKNQLIRLKLSGCSSLGWLYCHTNQLIQLDISGSRDLRILNCSENRLTSLKVSRYYSLRDVICSNNQLTSLDVSDCVNLIRLQCQENQLTNLNAQGCTILMELLCQENQLTNLNAQGCRSLMELQCQSNHLTSLNVTRCTDLRSLQCSDNQLTSLDVSDCSGLKSLDCRRNKIKSAEMSQLINSLPNRRGYESGRLEVVDKSAPTEENFCYQYDMDVARYKNWSSSYSGEPNRTCSVAKTVEGKGALSITGAADLGVVAYGTILTVVATPEKNYELVALTANGVDITATKKFVVKDDVIVKATFTKKAFAVTLSKAGEGTLATTGAEDLKAVPYGTEVTIVATPATGYELKSIEANGTDITATKKVVVREAVAVKATFVKKTFAVELTKEGEGTLVPSGAEDLSAVPYGTKLTITATPAEGYELVALVANNVDISDTKSIEVTEPMTITATFAKKSFAVTFDKVGEGTVTATGASNLNSVAYGTELTIVATPAEGYELTELTANGTDILASKKVTVKEALEVKATFTKKSFTVTLTHDGEGDLDATGSDDLKAVPYGTKLTVTATPAAGYELTALTANGKDILTAKSFIVKGATEIRATFSIKHFAITQTQEGEGKVDVTGADDLNAVAYGTELTIVATPAEGYELTALTANGTDILASKKVTVKEAVEVKATFTKKSFTVSLTKEGDGTISATGASNLNAVAYGTELTINATPAAGYELVSITANGADITATKKIVVKDNLTIKATFAKKNFSVSLTKEGEGTITATGVSNLNSVAYGTELTINATPARGYELVSITAGGTDITASKKVVVTGNLTVKATFAKKNFAVTFEKEGEGTISATGASNLNSVAYGTELTINATPAMGYELVSITAGGTDITASKKVVVTGNLTVKATFAKKNFAVSLTKEGEGTISATGASDLNAVAYGTELTIVATPAEGYELTALTANGTDILATKKVTVKETLEVKATFAKKSFAVSLTKEGEGTISATGATSLNAVAYGTELTINATPAEGYELTALTANGTDILATKKVTVKETLEVKATFAKKSFAVTFAKEGEGTITATGATSLNAVAYGTELTINATPAEGYELTALTANGTDILATKKVVVKEAVEVKATFAKKSFAVTFAKEGEGSITATGASSLNAVAYGTELTIVATPAAGYELVSITAGGTDITASKKVVVTGNLIVKATFAKKVFTASLTKEGEGTITATGASNLNSVAYGTELTIVATPAKGYELVSITAGGTDITASKKVVVTGNLTVKATFAKKSFAVSLTKEGEGTISATGASDLNAVAYGTELTINATPAMGYELVSITAGGTDITASKKVVVTDNMTVKATFAKKSFAVSLTKEGEGTISATGASNLNSVTYGTELTINATPAMGYELVSITAGDADITASKKVVVTGNLTIKATFAKKNFAVSLTKEGEGTITATGATSLNAVAYGTELTINATPAMGYELVSITAGGTDITASKKVVVTDNMTVKATFAKKNFAVSLTKEGEGMITATGASNLNSVAYGTELTINATPAEGYELQSLVAGCVDITATKKIVVKDNLTVKATFAKKNFAVSLTKEGEGTITATGASNLNSVAYGTELTINATPAMGYELVSITAGGTDITASKKVVVTDNLTVKATFAKKNFAVSLTKEGEGTITATGASNLNSVAYGTELTINATPAKGYELVSITAGGADITATKKVVVKDNLTVKATFAKKVFAVSLTKEGEGTITATGASDLNSVAYGTELTIVATPAEGYELTALTANGTDILATKKVVVEGNLTVKATFEKKTFAVTLTSNDHGEITIAEPVDLKAVPYGTTLTVKATGKNAQCVLTELTANGEDILATRSFVVTDVTEVKATFVDHTGVERTVKQQTQLYPNPATDYVIVEGVAPASEVTLHSMTGERLYAGRADDRGTLQIDLTPYADGVYLVCVSGETYRVVVRR